MTAHAYSYPGNARLRALIYADVAKGAGQPLREMDGVGVGDRLDRVFWMDVQKIFYGCGGGGMGWGESAGSHV